MTSTPSAPPPQPRAPRLRTALAATVITVPLLVVLVSAALWWDTLPADIASHWSDAGPADGSTTPAGHLTMCLTLTGVAAAGAWAIALVPTLSALARRAGFAIVGGFAGLGVAIWFSSIVVTIEAGAAERAVLGPWILLACAASLYGLIAVPIAPAGGAETPNRQHTAAVHTMPLRDSEESAWSLTMTSKLFVILAAGLGAFFIVLMVPLLWNAPDVSVVITLVAGLIAIGLLAMFSRLRLSIDRRGLRVTGLFGVPLKRITLDQIETVTVSTIDPGEWGGWGYRVLPGRSAIVMRRGQGLVLSLRDHKLFAATVPEPQVPAALLNTLVERGRRAAAEAH